MKATELKGENLSEFLQLIDGYYAGWSFVDSQILAGDASRFYSKNPDSIFYDTRPPVEGFQGVTALHEGVQGRAGNETVTSVRLMPRSDAWRAWRLGDIAWTVGSYHVTASTREGFSMDFDSRETHIWKKLNGQWLIVHEHASPPLPHGWLRTSRTPEPGVLSLPGASNPEFESFFDAYFAAWNENLSFDSAKTDAPARFYATDPNIILYDPGSKEALLGWSALRDFRASMYPWLKQMSYVRQGVVRVWQYEELAWTTFLFRVRLEIQDGASREFAGRQSVILERYDSEWRIVHEHLSMPVTLGE